MKNYIFTCSIFILALLSSGCTGEFFEVEDKYTITHNIKLSELNQVDCIDDIQIKPSKDYKAFIWSCDTKDSSLSSIYLNNSYKFYNFYANYNTQNEMLEINAYSSIMGSLFDSKEEMERVILNDVLSSIKKIQRDINSDKIREEKDANLRG